MRITVLLVLMMACAVSFAEEKAVPRAWVDPVTRYIHVTYRVPDNAPDEAQVRCSWSPAGRNDWKPIAVSPLLSDTGYVLATDSDRKDWEQGCVTERRAAGLQRTVIINPYPEMQIEGKVDADLRLEIGTLDTQIIRLQCDNSDVIYITDWSKILQPDAFAEGQWQIGPDFALSGKAGTPLPQLTYPLDLKGKYAVFVSTVPHQGSIGLRLSGDERTEYVASSHADDEMLWRWTAMDHQHLVLKQRHYYDGWAAASVAYIRLVPLSDDLYDKLNKRYSGKHDKFVAGYFEPYSWAFHENVQNNSQHREPLSAFQEAQVDLVDTQLGRFGAKMVYETRLADQLLYGTIGDPIGGKIPETGNVGRMQQYTNTLQSELKYAQELGLTLHANFGATNCYPGSPLQGDFSKQHPDWMRGSALRYEVPEVRRYIVGHFRETVRLGAPGVSIDFCRYPEGIDKPDTCNAFLRELRSAVGPKLPILIRFPAVGVRLSENFDYATWVREGLVNFLCPSNIQGRHLTFDIKPYVRAVRGTKCKLLPVVDALGWGLTFPGSFLQRVHLLYADGADGVYVYQADDPVVYHPLDRRYVRIAGSTDALKRWWNEDAEMRSRSSKGICITPPMDGKTYKKHERLRVWLEGIPMREIELHLDGRLVSRLDRPPYLLGTEEYDSDAVIAPGEHTLLVRAKDGEGWLEQTFKITGGK